MTPKTLRSHIFHWVAHVEAVLLRWVICCCVVEFSRGNWLQTRRACVTSSFLNSPQDSSLPVSMASASFFCLSNRKHIGQPHSDDCELNTNLRFWFLLKSNVYWELKQEQESDKMTMTRLCSILYNYYIHCLIFWFESCWDFLTCQNLYM